MLHWNPISFYTHFRPLLHLYRQTFFLQEQEILKFLDIYTKWVNLCIFLKEAFYFLIIFAICLLLQARYILIIQEILAFSVYLIVDLIFENSQFGFKVLSFQLAKSGNSKQWKYQFAWQKT